MSLFRGAGVAIVTPFTEEKNVNYEELGRLIEYQIEGGIDAIIVCGTTGEPVTMTEEERLSVISFTIEKVEGRVPVIAGTGGNCTENVITFSKKVERLGADGLLVVTPYYNKATQNGLYEHYKAVASVVDCPIIMYNVPSRTGTNLLPDTAARLGKEVDNIVALKEASGNITQVAEVIRRAEGALEIYSGNDDQIVPILSLGGIGVISVLANVVPGATHDMVNEYLDGNVIKARELQLKYMDLIQALFCEVNPIPVKKALELLGFQTKTLRMPLTEMEAKNVVRLEKAMQQVGLLASEKQ
ncbi:MAG: 4-hydroxy-tetrahydrodipicolinate synthase [Agathobacter sp.]|nr:4-hydroxy-tetrahydrodipicolinate synthase [Agathobacter sp.]